MTFRTRLASWSLPVLLFGVPLCAALALEHAGAAGRRAAPIRFRDVSAQTIQFIGYSKSIVLTAEQQDFRNRVLNAIPAPCCKDYPMATCCCPCNLAKSVWGLSNYLIVEKSATEAQLHKTVRQWLAFTNASGYSGDVCDTGGCSRAFSANGCGGMDEAHIVSR
ncbi:MAG: hypothetical protein ACRD3M_03455 [Thermoanaerobaculia bacterium]